MKEVHIGDSLEINDLIDCYKSIGIELDYNSIKKAIVATYNDGECNVSKNLNEININDINAAYKGKINEINDYVDDKGSYMVIYSLLRSIYRNDYEKERCHKRIFEELKMETGFILVNNTNNNELANINISKADIKKALRNINDYDIVDDIDDGLIPANKGRKVINKTAFAVVAGLIIIGSALFVSSHIKNKINNVNEKTYNDDKDSEIDVNNNTNENANINKSINIENANEEKTKLASEPSTESKESEPELPEQSNSVDEITDIVYSSIQNTKLANEYSKDDIKKIVEYAQNIDNSISHETAYEIYTQFVRAGVDISEFYKGIDCYEELKKLDKSAKNIVQELNNYEDEYDTYKSIENVLNNLKDNSYTQAVALRAYIDQYIPLQSMTLMLNIKEYDEKGKEIFHGNTYNEEISKIASSKIEECKNIYNQVNANNPDAKLSKIISSALDQDNQLSR